MSNEKILVYAISYYQIELLKFNDIKYDALVTYATDTLINRVIKKPIYIIDAENVSFNFFNARKTNNKIYSNLTNYLSKSNFDKLIIFSDYKPVERLLIDYFHAKNKKIELWEDGIGYYIGYDEGFTYFLKSSLKRLMGFYSKGFLQKTYRRSEMVLKDRLLSKNIKYSFVRSQECIFHNRILIIGQPFVEYGIIGRYRYDRIIKKIAQYFKYEVEYIYHPRERAKPSIDSIILTRHLSVSIESFLQENAYRCYLSAYSTVLINIETDNKYYIPKVYGLIAISRKLKKFIGHTIPIADNLNQIKIK
jgi:hypothetical protein